MAETTFENASWLPRLNADRVRVALSYTEMVQVNRSWWPYWRSPGCHELAGGVDLSAKTTGGLDAADRAVLPKSLCFSH